jgi:hypothetical protein
MAFGVDTSLRESFLDEITVIYAEVKAVLDERQRRLVLGSAARRLGRGGINTATRRRDLGMF